MVDKLTCGTCQAFQFQSPDPNSRSGICKLNPEKILKDKSDHCMQHITNVVMDESTHKTDKEFCVTCLEEKSCPEHTVGHIPIS